MFIVVLCTPSHDISGIDYDKFSWQASCTQDVNYLLMFIYILHMTIRISWYLCISLLKTKYDYQNISIPLAT